MKPTLHSNLTVLPTVVAGLAGTVFPLTKVDIAGHEFAGDRKTDVILQVDRLNLVKFSRRHYTVGLHSVVR